MPIDKKSFIELVMETSLRSSPHRNWRGVQRWRIVPVLYRTIEDPDLTCRGITLIHLQRIDSPKGEFESGRIVLDIGVAGTG